MKRVDGVVPYGVSSNSEWNSTLPSKLTTATISDTVISRLRDAIAETANTSLITMDGERDGGKGDVIRSQRWNKFAHVRVDGNGVVWVLSCAAKIGVSLPSLHDEVEEERKNDALVGVNGVVVKREKKVLMRDAVGGVLFAATKIFLDRLLNAAVKAARRDQFGRDSTTPGFKLAVQTKECLLVPLHLRRAVLEEQKFDFLCGIRKPIKKT